MESCCGCPGQREDVRQMKTVLLVNDYIVPLNEFIQNYIGNVLRGIVLSLGYDSKDITVHVDHEGLRILTENGEIPIVKDFAKSLIESTIKGVLSPLNGVFWLERITIASMVFLFTAFYKVGRVFSCCQI